KDYKILELNNVMVLNQTAKSLEDSDVIEYECMLSGDLRKKMDVWDNVEELIKSAKPDVDKSAPEFYIYERNGEINEKEYNQAKKKEGGKEDKFFLTKVIVGGIEKDKPTTILFCEKIDDKPYKEYHRSSYSGRWLRMGLYEVLMDIQTRANEIGNQISRGLEWASKKVFASPDRLLAQNILTDLQNGDVVRTSSLVSVDTRMVGIDQLIADWNRLMVLADQLANSYEVVTGESSPSGTPFRLAAQQNLNANKLFDFIREKLSIASSCEFLSSTTTIKPSPSLAKPNFRRMLSSTPPSVFNLAISEDSFIFSCCNSATLFSAIFLFCLVTSILPMKPIMPQTKNSIKIPKNPKTGHDSRIFLHPLFR
ncbi:MAG: hypothetical protein UU07_C0017G0001, partial [Parcubacteria group bacterium GW2011_GWF1_40_5]